MLRAQLELGQVKQEIDRRIAEKEEEFNNTRYVVEVQFFNYLDFFEISEEIHFFYDKIFLQRRFWWK